MIRGNYLYFINDKIEKLKTAIFYNFSQSLLRFPTCIIKVIGFDENGNMWFAIKKPYDDISDFDNEFRAVLKFYNKNFRFYISVEGKATIIQEEDKCREDVLIRFRIYNAEYHYSKSIPATSFNIPDYIGSFFRYEKWHHSLQFWH